MQYSNLPDHRKTHKQVGEAGEEVALSERTMFPQPKHYFPNHLIYFVMFPQPEQHQLTEQLTDIDFYLFCPPFSTFFVQLN